MDYIACALSPLSLPWVISPVLRRSCLAFAWIFAYGVATPAYANPELGNVASGAATITSAGSTLTVTQHTDTVLIDWRRFNVAPGEQAVFDQSSGAVALNRINDTQASHIEGAIAASSNVVLLNRSGIIVASGVTLDPHVTIVDANGIFIAQGNKIDANAIVSAAICAAKPLPQFEKLPVNYFDSSAAPYEDAQAPTAQQAGLAGMVPPAMEGRTIVMARLTQIQFDSGPQWTIDMYGDGLMEVGVNDIFKNQHNHYNGTVMLLAESAQHIINNIIPMHNEPNKPVVKARGRKIIISDSSGTKIKNGG
jgi:filamentous hemagglutinin family protein